MEGLNHVIQSGPWRLEKRFGGQPGGYRTVGGQLGAVAAEGAGGTGGGGGAAHPHAQARFRDKAQTAGMCSPDGLTLMPPGPRICHKPPRPSY